MTLEERANELVWQLGVCLAAGDSEKAKELCVEHLNEAIAQQKEKDAKICETEAERVRKIMNIKNDMRTIAMGQCAKAIREQP